MKKVKILFAFLLIINSVFAFSQQTDSKVKYISFHFYHSMRIPYREVTIEIFKKRNNALVKVLSKAAKDDKRWDYSRVKKQFEIDLKTFEELASNIVVLQTIDLPKDDGKDGNSCIIEFGKGGKNMEYKVWTPEYDTDQRGLTYFMERCKELILIGKLNPEEIFSKKVHH